MNEQIEPGDEKLIEELAHCDAGTRLVAAQTLSERGQTKWAQFIKGDDYDFYRLAMAGYNDLWGMLRWSSDASNDPSYLKLLALAKSAHPESCKIVLKTFADAPYVGHLPIDEEFAILSQLHVAFPERTINFFIEIAANWTAYNNREFDPGYFGFVAVERLTFLRDTRAIAPLAYALGGRHDNIARSQSWNYVPDEYRNCLLSLCSLKQTGTYEHLAEILTWIWTNNTGGDLERIIFDCMEVLEDKRTGFFLNNQLIHHRATTNLCKAIRKRGDKSVIEPLVEIIKVNLPTADELSAMFAKPCLPDANKNVMRCNNAVFALAELGFDEGLASLTAKTINQMIDITQFMMSRSAPRASEDVLGENCTTLQKSCICFLARRRVGRAIPALCSAVCNQKIYNNTVQRSLPIVALHGLFELKDMGSAQMLAQRLGMLKKEDWFAAKTVVAMIMSEHSRYPCEIRNNRQPVCKFDDFWKDISPCVDDVINEMHADDVDSEYWKHDRRSERQQYDGELCVDTNIEDYEYMGFSGQEAIDAWNNTH